MNSQLPQIAAPLGADYIDFAELLRLLGRLRWQILAITALFTVLGIMVAFSTEPIYRGAVTLLIEARPSHAVQQVQEVYDPGYQNDEYFETQTELLKSRELVGHVVDQLKLVDNAEILPPEEPSALKSRSPDVRVTVTQYRSFYVTGQVQRPGAYPFVTGLTIEKALALAGGMTNLASARRIYLLHEDQPTDQRVRVGMDAQVAPGDTLLVEESLF